MPEQAHRCQSRRMRAPDVVARTDRCLRECDRDYRLDASLYLTKQLFTTGSSRYIKGLQPVLIHCSSDVPGAPGTETIKDGSNERFREAPRNRNSSPAALRAGIDPGPIAGRRFGAELPLSRRRQAASVGAGDRSARLALYHPP